MGHSTGRVGAVSTIPVLEAIGGSMAMVVGKGEGASVPALSNGGMDGTKVGTEGPLTGAVDAASS